MKARNIVPALGFAALLGACMQNSPASLGGPGSGNGSGSGSGNGSGPGSGSGSTTGAQASSGGAEKQGRAIFDAEVRPILESVCAECHSGADAMGPEFLGASPDQYYAGVEASGYVTLPESSMLLLKGAHAGPAFTSGERASVVAWLTVEAEERGLGGGSGAGGSTSTGGEPPPPILTIEDAIQQWGDCMSLADWEATNMDSVANQNTTAGPCKSCHVTGTGGAFLSEESSQTFEMNHDMPYILKLVLPQQDANGSVTGWVHADRFVDKGGEQGSHPKYIMTFERQLAIDNFVGLTIDNWEQGPCSP